MKNPLLLKSASFINALPIPGGEVAVDVRGHLMSARSWDRALALLLWKRGWLEAAESATLRRYCRRGMVAVDIGANIGFHTLQMARWAGPQGKVYAFEPDPFNFDLLVKNVLSNALENVICLRKAVADHEGQSSLLLNPCHKGDHRLYGSPKGRTSISVETVSLDEFLSEEQRVDLIKMDIQGAEHRALLGMQKLLLRSPEAVVISELAPDLMAESGNSVEDFFKKTDELGLETALLSQDGQADFGVTSQYACGMLREGGCGELTILLRSPKNRA